MDGGARRAKVLVLMRGAEAVDDPQVRLGAEDLDMRLALLIDRWYD